MKTKKRKRIKPHLILPLLILTVAAVIVSVVIYQRYQLGQAMAASLEKEIAALDLQVDEKLLEVEYGANINRLMPVVKCTGKLSYYGNVNTMEPGTYDITYRLSSVDEYVDHSERR